MKARAPAVFLNARIDTYWLSAKNPPPQAETLQRSQLYAAAGADGIFVPGLVDAPSIAALVDSVDAPINILYTPGRHKVGTLAALGVRRISTGSLLFRAAVHAATATAHQIRNDEPIASAAPSYAEIQQLIT